MSSRSSIPHPSGGRPASPLRCSGRTAEPQRGRIALFDAIIAYNLYDPSQTEHAGYGASSGFLIDSLALYERYREAAPDKPVI